MRIIGKITAINTSDGQYNLVVLTCENESFNIKIKIEDADDIKIGGIYQFDCDIIEHERTSYLVNNHIPADKLEYIERNNLLRHFCNSSPLSLEDEEKEINKYINLLDNKIIKDITIYLINKFHDDFFIYPAATKFHHAYVGGLAYHSIGMLHLANAFIENYNYLDKNYVFAGIMLHDIGKTIELTGAVNTEYSLKGQLLGHLVLGAMEISDAAKVLGYSNTEEALMLEHMLISHHGQPQFGSAKKPMTPEALALWFIDTIDSKFRVLGEELENTEDNTFTDAIGVLDRGKFYKVK